MSVARARSCSTSLRFPTGQQLVTKLVTAPMGTVMVPTTMIMGQVVTAYSPFQQQGQPQAITLQQQQPPPQPLQAQADSQTQAVQGQTTQPGVAQQAQQQAQFLQVNS